VPFTNFCYETKNEKKIPIEKKEKKPRKNPIFIIYVCAIEKTKTEKNILYSLSMYVLPKVCHLKNPDTPENNLEDVK
jgi:hypothetical protein